MVGLSIGQKEYMNFSTTESQAGIRSQAMEVARQRHANIDR
jgi:hypothetical protein